MSTLLAIFAILTFFGLLLTWSLTMTRELKSIRSWLATISDQLSRLLERSVRRE